MTSVSRCRYENANLSTENAHIGSRWVNNFANRMKKTEIKRIYQLDRKGFTDSKEENRKDKDQIQQKLQGFESER